MKCHTNYAIDSLFYTGTLHRGARVLEAQLGLNMKLDLYCRFLQAFGGVFDPKTRVY